MYAQVLIEYTNKALDKSFTYIIPKEMRGTLKVGMKVKVPFNNRVINGFVIDIKEENNTEYELKSVASIEDENLILDRELLDLGEYLQSKTLCSKIVAYQTMLPSSLKIKNQNVNYTKYETYVYLNEEKDYEEYIKEHKTRKAQIEIIKELSVKKEMLKGEISSKSALDKLIEEGIVLVRKVQKYRINVLDSKNDKKNELTRDQARAVETVDLSKHDTYLLYGVTGSGKTEVYMNLMDKVIKIGKRAIMLVPEISLTTQMISRFYSRFGSRVAIFHSGLSNGEKYDEYLKIYRNEIDIVVGTRSAIFTPLKNIGLIVLDEEHSETFKQDSNPRYNAVDMAIFRGKYNNCPVILGSATPSLEAMARARKGIFKLIVMPNRVGGAVLPQIEIVDMALEMKKRNTILSEHLQDEIRKNLERGEQTILLLNRRGHSTIVTCQACGYVYKCPYCDISLTYHKTSNNLRCHYCGYTALKDNICPECHEEALNYMGLGTEKLEQTLKEMYKDARIVRMDVDTTSNKGSHEKIINDFKEHKYDILLGTQMISKGLDFPLVTLVGVINADSSLNIPDFRSGERTFELLSQVAGRAGRSNLAGRVIIQTFNPDNQYLNFVKENSYEKFYNYEMNFRKTLKYSPYYYLISVMVTGREYEVVSKEATKAFNYLKSNIDKTSFIYGPTTASVFRVNNVYRFQIMIKYRFDNKAFAALKYLDSIYAVNSKVNFEIDINPLRM